ncbi:MAG: hypothetical protein ABEJ23_00955 [Haloarculaceae archaeon]
MVRVQVTLTGEKADRFRELRDALEDQLGYRPSRPETVGLLMAADVDVTAALR